MDYLGAASLFLIDWLSRNKTADNLQRVGYTWNWDYGTAVLRWIIEQPQCDRATAKRIFLLCPAEDLLRFPNAEAVTSLQRDEFALANRIATLWNAGFYTSAEFFFDPATEGMDAYRQNEQKYRAQGLPWHLPPDFDLPEGKRDVDFGSFSEGFSQELGDALKDKGIRSPRYLLL